MSWNLSSTFPFSLRHFTRNSFAPTDTHPSPKTEGPRTDLGGKWEFHLYTVEGVRRGSESDGTTGPPLRTTDTEASPVPSVVVSGLYGLQTGRSTFTTPTSSNRPNRHDDYPEVRSFRTVIEQRGLKGSSGQKDYEV